MSAKQYYFPIIGVSVYCLREDLKGKAGEESWSTFK